MSKQTCLVDVHGSVRGVGSLNFAAYAGDMTRVSGMALYSRFDEYSPILFTDIDGKVGARLSYESAGDNLACNDQFRLEITREDKREVDILINASRTCQPASVKALKVELMKSGEIKDASLELTDEIKKKYAAKLNREPRTSYYEALQDALDFIYPSEKSAAIVESKSSLKSSNDISRLNLIAACKARGIACADDISLVDVTNLFVSAMKT